MLYLLRIVVAVVLFYIVMRAGHEENEKTASIIETGGFFAFTGGIIITIVILVWLVPAVMALQWPTTDGVVTMSRVASQITTEGTKYRVDIAYTYWPPSGEYSGNHIELDDPPGSREEIQQIVDRYPEGTEVTVSYNPDKPSEAILEPGATTKDIVDLGTFLGLTVLGGWAFWRSYRKRTRDKSA